MFCNNCGAQLREGDLFCSKCGNRVVTDDTAIQEENEKTAVPDAEIDMEKVEQSEELVLAYMLGDNDKLPRKGNQTDPAETHTDDTPAQEKESDDARMQDFMSELSLAVFKAGVGLALGSGIVSSCETGTQPEAPDEAPADIPAWRVPLLECLEMQASDLLETAEQITDAASERDLLMPYLNTLPDFTPWDGLPSASKSNVLYTFICPDYGARLGLIDTGVLRKKGKSGILFFENGLCVKPMMGSAISVGYDKLCTAVIEDSSDYISDYKFSVLKDDTLGMYTVSAAGIIADWMRNIRSILLQRNVRYHDLFTHLLTAITDRIVQSARSGETLRAAGTSVDLRKYTTECTDEIRTIVTCMKALVDAANESFDRAKKTAAEAAVEAVMTCIDVQHKEYLCAKSKEAYESAQQAYEEQNWKQVIDFAQESIDFLPTEENWSLLIRTICETAMEENQYYYDLLNLLRDPKWKDSSIKFMVLERMDSQVRETEEKAKLFYASLEESIPQRISDNDNTYFENNLGLVNHQDRFGMTPLMYSVMYRKESLYDTLVYLSSSEQPKTVLGFGIAELAALNCRLGFFMKVDEKFDPVYKEELSSYRRDKGKAVVNNIATSILIADIYTGSSTESFESRMNKYQKDLKKQTLSVIMENAYLDLSDYPEIPDQTEKLPDIDTKIEIDDPGLPDPENDVAFQTYLAEKEQHFLQDYMEKNCPPKGEFEKSVDFKARREAAKQAAAAEYAERFDLEAVRQAYHDDFMKNQYEAKESVIQMQLDERNQQLEIKQKERQERDVSRAKIIFAGKLLSSCLDFPEMKLSQYDADGECFMLLCDSITAKLPIPIDIAAEFKTTYKDAAVPYSVQSTESIGKGIFRIACAVSFQEHISKFDLCLKINRKGKGDEAEYNYQFKSFKRFQYRSNAYDEIVT